MKPFIIIALASLFILTGCTQPMAVQTKQSSNQAHAALANDSSIVLIDVRTVAEFEEGHIQGSINVPLDQLSQEITRVVSDKKTTVFLVCRSGNRSAQASDIMASLGYQSLVDIGSVFTWPDPLVIFNP